MILNIFSKMGAKKFLFTLLVMLVLIIAIIHIILHSALFGTGIPGFYKSGISGFSIGQFSPEAFRETNTDFLKISWVIIIAEWALLIIMITIAIKKSKMDLKKEFNHALLKEKHSRGEHKTDLDVLYDILKEKKHLHLQTIAKIFKVEAKVAKNWCQILVSGNLATLEYPRFGDPELILNEEKSDIY